MSLIIFIMFNIINSIMIIIPVLLAVALLTLLERKVIGYMQFRKGPNLVGPLGVLQPIADGLKLFIKESIKPSTASPFLFYLAPVIFFFLAVVLWGAMPLVVSGSNLTFSALFVIAISSLSVYAVLGAGWASNTKYAMLGAMRGVAQTISYEVCFTLIVLPIVLFSGSWSLSCIVSGQETGWLIFPCFPLFVMWYISTLAETNRAPFDLAEGESELVSGYNVEYAGAPFALFFIGEYSNIILMNLLTVLLFLGGGSPGNWLPFCVVIIVVKTVSLIFSFLWVRSSFPRVRYDHLMGMMWKGFLPLTIGFLILFYVVLFILGVCPPYSFF